MMRAALGVALFVCVMAANTAVTRAESTLSVQPLQYTESLQKGEKKRAFIDVSNPSSQPAIVQFDVQAFKQVDEKGTLAFYDDARLDEGILLDITKKEIPAHKTLRLFFIVDGAKLPTGDVFAAVFARTQSDEKVMRPSVRIGTLLLLTNGTPGARKAEVMSFTTPLFHFDESIKGEIKIKNTASTDTSSGFMPKIDLRMWPFGPNSVISAPLVFAGNTRTVAFDQPSNQLGIYKISVSHGKSHKDRWVILVTGVWRWVALGVIVGIVLVAFCYKFVYKKFPKRRR